MKYMLNSLLVGSYISRLRKEKDFTQMEIANLLNVSHQAVSKWERGESLPDLGTLVELASLFLG
jgi:transcriptional regulator with XRE-family HTH domain